MLLWEVPRSRSEGEAAIILLGHLVDTNSLSIGQPDNESPVEGQALSPSSAQVTQGHPARRIHWQVKIFTRAPSSIPVLAQLQH